MLRSLPTESAIISTDSESGGDGEAPEGVARNLHRPRTRATFSSQEPPP